MAPFKVMALGTVKVTCGLASACIANPQGAGAQVVISAPQSNTDVCYVEFVATIAGVAVVPVAAGALGSFPINPGAQLELTVPYNMGFIAHISLTAAQTLLFSSGGDQ